MTEPRSLMTLSDDVSVTSSTRVPLFGADLTRRQKATALGICSAESASQLFFEEGYDFVAIPLTTEDLKYRVESLAPTDKLAEFHEVEVGYYPNEFTNQVFGLASPWIELDSDDPLVVQRSSEVALREAEYAEYCGLQAVILFGPRNSTNSMQYGAVIMELLNKTNIINIFVRIDISNNEADYFSSWKVWQAIRTACDYHPRLHVALEMPIKESPPIELISRWYAEPIGVLIMSCLTFVANPKGYPVLGRKHKAILSLFLQLKPRLLLCDNDEPNRVGASPDYSIYLKHLIKTQPPPPVVEDFAEGYKDYLQIPLQPLSHDLENITYEVFERDPVKYAQYEQAIHAALADRPEDSVTRIAVVGAGRGPLVDCALRAAIQSGRTVDMIALEKNPNAFSMLVKRNREDWASKVTLVFGDMRQWRPDYKVDILVSELLGSMGDNELSPECLDGAQAVLDEETGISIPSSYVPFVTPIMSQKLWTEARKLGNGAFDRAYVVLMNAFDFIATDDEYRFQPLWAFHHPDRAAIQHVDNTHNKRHAHVRFQVSTPGVVHGFAGYFEATLYKDISLSILPTTMDVKSPDMFSWFPMYIPVQNPIYVPENSQLEFQMWRQTDGTKVWFEWAANSYTILRNGKHIELSSTRIHNPSGKVSYCDLS
ncbi:type II protein arginine N-methyltransferase Skb1 [Schizosaccharomyces japonicus yFS275]|uniref:Protein arginine N-methyltransferase n=1 Tax=Schizosaccharomyces japonicus (strain yFS275 / FY16936) TaxID=402676 RepID=B6JW27_SCHJY|nr:type II protein arginine N-methyltransferase Skb1 [Schizosaccharomyces japonicus yFS275]EEB05578.1 type II protein arginine N-methyltransferase Skb1 [Schizosaccharomyces japonicus yFS275]